MRVVEHSSTDRFMTLVPAISLKLAKSKTLISIPDKENGRARDDTTDDGISPVGGRLF